jgi:NAD(P)-dependent dehydrogenase (short-subunit alcohol dehydrogenase family)
MKLENKTIFVSGANRGIGKAIVEALLKQQVFKIYAAARNVADVPKFGDTRVARRVSNVSSHPCNSCLWRCCVYFSKRRMVSKLKFSKLVTQLGWVNIFGQQGR